MVFAENFEAFYEEKLKFQSNIGRFRFAVMSFGGLDSGCSLRDMPAPSGRVPDLEEKNAVTWSAGASV